MHHVRIICRYRSTVQILSDEIWSLCSIWLLKLTVLRSNLFYFLVHRSCFCSLPITFEFYIFLDLLFRRKLYLWKDNRCFYSLLLLLIHLRVRIQKCNFHKNNVCTYRKQNSIVVSN